MKPTVYKKGIFFDTWGKHSWCFGIGIYWYQEKYLYINLFNFEIAIGKVIN